MYEYIIGYGSLAIVALWLTVVFVRARYYKKTSISDCDMNCASCRARCEEEQKNAKLKAMAERNKTSS